MLVLVLVLVVREAVDGSLPLPAGLEPVGVEDGDMIDPAIGEEHGMDATAEDLLGANLQGVFGERDAAERHAIAMTIYTDDVRFTDPDETVVGREALEAKAAGLLEGAPGFVFTDEGPAYVAADRAAMAWAFGPEGAPPVARGVDVLTIVDGRISEVLTLLVRN